MCHKSEEQQDIIFLIEGFLPSLEPRYRKMILTPDFAKGFKMSHELKKNIARL